LSAAVLAVWPLPAGVCVGHDPGAADAVGAAESAASTPAPPEPAPSGHPRTRRAPPLRLSRPRTPSTPGRAACRRRPGARYRPPTRPAAASTPGTGHGGRGLGGLTGHRSVESAAGVRRAVPSRCVRCARAGGPSTPTGSSWATSPIPSLPRTGPRPSRRISPSPPSSPGIVRHLHAHQRGRDDGPPQDVMDAR
jgi:hypothetical protein